MDQAVIKRRSALNFRLFGDVTDIHRISSKPLDSNAVCGVHAVEDTNQLAIMNQGELSLMLRKKAVAQFQECSTGVLPGTPM